MKMTQTGKGRFVMTIPTPEECKVIYQDFLLNLQTIKVDARLLLIALQKGGVSSRDIEDVQTVSNFMDKLLEKYVPGAAASCKKDEDDGT